MGSNGHDIGAVSDFRSGQPHRVTAVGRNLVVVRKDDTFFVMRDICPHQGAPLSNGVVDGTPAPCLPGEEIRLHRVGEILICPWHGWEFDLRSGLSLADSRRGRLSKHPVRIVGERVIVEL